VTAERPSKPPGCGSSSPPPAFFQAATRSEGSARPCRAGGAIISVGVRALLGRSLGAEALLQQLVQIGLGAVLVLVEGVHEL
jgi:hypothetical protein